jgi:hypothetical protein
MPHSSFFIKQNDTSPALEGICRDGLGSPVDLTGASVVFNMRVKPAGAVKVSTGTMTAVGSAVNGRQQYVWTASDTDTAGTYEGEVQATFSNGKIRTFPPDGYFEVVVTDDVA